MPSDGVTTAFTVTGKVAVLAHCPTVGVKVKLKLPAPAVAGLKVLPETPVPDQVPFIPPMFMGKLAAGSLVQKGPMGLGVGVTAGLMVTFIVVGRAHWPTPGVKVAVMVLPPCPDGLMVVGFQVPVIP